LVLAAPPVPNMRSGPPARRALRPRGPGAAEPRRRQPAGTRASLRRELAGGPLLRLVFNLAPGLPVLEQSLLGVRERRDTRLPKVIGSSGKPPPWISETLARRLRAGARELGEAELHAQCVEVWEAFASARAWPCPSTSRYPRVGAGRLPNNSTSRQLLSTRSKEKTARSKAAVDPCQKRHDLHKWIEALRPPAVLQQKLLDEPHVVEPSVPRRDQLSAAEVVRPRAEIVEVHFRDLAR
jgi:hypothetical protein